MSLHKHSATVFAASGFLAAACAATAPATAAGPAKPNILFVILDDVGIDQMPMFGFGGVRPPSLPNFTRIAESGVKFSNVWAMPQCSSSRTSFFTGRLPSRTGVGLAILDNHLPQTYLSSYESTVPRLLKTVGYTSALVGKYHLGNERDPAQDCAPAARGFDAFAGNMTAGPPSIDTTGGGVKPEGSFVCGYDQSSAAGACYRMVSGSLNCKALGAGNTIGGTTPARACLQSGGIFTPGERCGADEPTPEDFQRTNAYYSWKRFAYSGSAEPTLSTCAAKPVVDRTYMSVQQQQDGVQWWTQQTGPRMLTLAFNAIHTPLQKPPTLLVPDPQNQPATCNAMMPDRNTINKALEGMDTALGRALAQMGLATLAADTRTIASLDLKDTMVVIIGDNGSFGSTVRLTDGFDAGRAKGTAYQTGVWVPLIVAGPQVTQPGRTIDALISGVDLYGLFADIAGVDATRTVPTSHRLDSRPLHVYLTDTAAPAQRTINYTEINQGTFSKDPDDRSWPCVIGSQCSEVLFPDEEFCHDNGGTWYGPGAAKSYTSCCAVAAANPGQSITPMAISQRAARNARFKLVRSERMDCAVPLAGSGQQPSVPWAEFATTTRDEWYDLKKTSANPVGMDLAGNDALAKCSAADPASCLPVAQRPIYRKLDRTIDTIASQTKAEASCQAKGDGNLDMRVNGRDIEAFKAFQGKGPSRYDINVDGETDAEDLAIIRANLGADCISVCRRADLDRNGRVETADLNLLVSLRKTCSDDTLCNGDMDGNGRIDLEDHRKMRVAINQCGGITRSADAMADAE